MNYKTTNQTQTAIKYSPLIITKFDLLQIPDCVGIQGNPRLRIYSYMFNAGFSPEVEVVFYNLLEENGPCGLRKNAVYDTEGNLCYYDVCVLNSFSINC